jgi:serine/threonine-protein kinase RsbW
VKDGLPDNHDEILSVCLPATLESVDLICEKVKKLWAELGLSQSAFAIQLLLRETLNNAVIHGTKSNPEKRIKCSIRKCENEYMELAVSDNGHGFDWIQYWDHQSDADSSSGRGIEIMRRYGKEVRFNEEGNRVTILFDSLGRGTHGNDKHRQQQS